ncbi:hypothetical protein SteCoe_24189 [Stentor coeruleus]|uniref:SDE2-like domain-containing protein n=1 Tax=Stentor coeruleus TaxID=5963 RepID=A0A1R2BI41_9CILI|nr:hypothetical protein SteCoe_24189 [Stentor coeruleus]
MHQIFIRGVKGEVLIMEGLNANEILKKYADQSGIPIENLRASQFSRPLGIMIEDAEVLISLKILGGKGGFGSMLRGQGMIARVNNFDACRDLHGRRIRDVNNEIRLNEWKEKQNDKKKIEGQVNEEPQIPKKRNIGYDKQHKAEVQKSMQDVKSAFAEGLKRRKIEEVNEKEVNEKEVNEKEVNEKEVNEKEVNEKDVNEKVVNEN